jgi:signal transduction histidine kinase
MGWAFVVGLARAHGESVSAGNRDHGGAQISATLPLTALNLRSIEKFNHAERNQQSS